MNKHTKMFIGIALVGVAGFLLYQQYEKNKKIGFVANKPTPKMKQYSGGVTGRRSNF